jgi:hypothetical protein
MKWQAVIVLLALGFSIAVPMSFSIPSDHGNHSMIGNLDVCHSSVPAISANGGMPCVHQCPCDHMHLVQVKIAQIAHPRFRPFLIAFQDERPPKS